MQPEHNQHLLVLDIVLGTDKPQGIKYKITLFKKLNLGCVCGIGGGRDRFKSNKANK